MMVVSMRPRSHLKGKIQDGLGKPQCKVRCFGIEILDRHSYPAFGPIKDSRLKLEQEKDNLERICLSWLELHNERVTEVEPAPLP